ncbi:MAG: hypothetical protein LBG27_09575 [Spirochaetaceae bacterium]|jgi:hypothetical protein|nr:hypothetical protein [Spirochaetaceae bacterium]
MALGGRTWIVTLEMAKLDYLIGKPIGEEMSAAERRGFHFKYLTDCGKRQKINEIMEAEEEIAMVSEMLMWFPVMKAVIKTCD